MPLLKFEVEADYDKVIRLRKEIAELESTLKGMDMNTPIQEVQKVESRLAQASKEFEELTSAASMAGSVLEGGFKKKIYDASQEVNRLTDNIITQREYVHGLQSNLRDLCDEYKELSKNPIGEDHFISKDLQKKIKALKTEINEEKDALFNLTQQQARAKLTVKELADEYSSLQKEAGCSTQEIDAFKRSIKDLTKDALGIVGIGMTLKEVVEQTVKTRGEFQQLEVSFKTMLGNGEAASALMQQLTRTAAITPFDLKGVADGAKSLLAYGIAANEVNDILTRLGDIAAGLSIPLGDLVYLYGTTMTQGRMYTQDLRQFMGRGIPLAEELAKQFGVTKDKVGELVTVGKVGAEEFKKAIISMTDSGSTFGGLMEAQSATISGQISNIEDAIASMFNDIGKHSESLINGALGGISELVENYERVGRTLMGLTTAYGVYRTACILATASTKGLTATQMVQYNWTLLVEKAQKLLNATMLANPYVLAAAALGTVIVALSSVKTETELLRDAEKRCEEQKKKIIESEQQHKNKIEELCSASADEAVATNTRREALYQLEKKYPDIFAKYDTEYDKLKNIAAINREIIELEAQRSITNPINELDHINNIITELENKRQRQAAVSMNGIAGGMSVSAGWNKEDEARLKAAQKRKYELTQEIRKNEIDSYILGLSTKKKDSDGKETSEYLISNEDLEKKITLLTNLQAKMKISAANGNRMTKGKIEGGDLDGIYSEKEIEVMLNRLKGEKAKRDAKTGSSADWLTDLKKKSAEATKAYNDFVQNHRNSLSQEDFEKKAKELKDAADMAKKEYNKYKPNNDGAALKEQKDANKKANEELALTRRHQQAMIDVLAEGTEKRVKQINLDYEKQKDAIEKQERELRQTNNGQLSNEQIEAISAQHKANETNRDKSLQDVYMEELAAMRDYLKEYGTYQQQKLAIAEEYAEKIKSAQTEGERLSLAKERDVAMRQVEMKAIDQQIDWQAVFGGFTGALESQLRETLASLKDYVKTDKFKGSSTEDKKLIYEAIERIQQQLPGDNKGTLNFGKLKEQMAALGDAINEAQAAYKADVIAQNNLVSAQAKYNEALKSGDKAAIDAAKTQLEIANTMATASAAAYTSATDNLQTLGAEVRESSKETVDGLNMVADGLQGFASGTLSGVFAGLQNTLTGLSKLNLGESVNKAVSKLSDTLSSAGVIGQIISAALGILDILKDGIGTLVASLIDTVMSAVTGILDDILSGDFAVQIGKSLRDGIGNILNTVTFGGFGSLFSSSNAKWVAETTERLTARNEILCQSIDALKEEMSRARGMKTVQAYDEAYKAQKELIANTGGVLAAQMGYHGAHHSNSYYIDKAMSSADWKQITALVGQKVAFSGDLWNLSPEQLKKLQGNPELWTKIYTSGKYDKTEYLDQYIELADSLDELTEQLNETLTQISFDSMYDSFVDSLMDMDKKAEDVADDVAGYFMRAMLSNKIGDLYADRLEEWYKRFADNMRDGTLDATERQALNDEYMAMVNEAMALRDQIAAATGYDKTASAYQQGSTGGYATQLSEDTGSEIVGRATALLDGVYRLEALDIERNNLIRSTETRDRELSIIEVTYSQVCEMAKLYGEAYTVHVDCRRILTECYLELQQIRENTGAIIKPINSMKESLEKIEKNTKDLA